MKASQDEIEIIQDKYLALDSSLNEKSRRIWAATEAKAYGFGGVALVCESIGIAPNTVYKAIKELQEGSLPTDRIRHKGGGRKAIKDKQKGILKALEALVDPCAKGDPEKPLRWTSKSVRKLAAELNKQGYTISKDTVYILLKKLGYRLSANKKDIGGGKQPDRDAQFKYINESILAAQANKQPSLSVDAKKKEIIGNYKNNGREYAEKGKPIKVKTHDFIDKKLGKVTPYGLYDIGSNSGWFSVGVSKDTAQFAVNTIRTWWYTDGVKRYPKATEILITADCGGSNGYRNKLWKVELQKLANELQLEIKVRHFPPGTSKWNKIEHRLFSYISKNWRSKPLISREVVVNLIANTTTTTGLTVSSVLDENEYETGIKVTEKQMKSLNKREDDFHPEWNYSLLPNNL